MATRAETIAAAALTAAEPSAPTDAPATAPSPAPASLTAYGVCQACKWSGATAVDYPIGATFVACPRCSQRLTITSHAECDTCLGGSRVELTIGKAASCPVCGESGDNGYGPKPGRKFHVMALAQTPARL